MAEIENIKVTAIVVTFNRLDLLKKSIGTLLRQSSPLNSIIVINNGSTDGTAEWLNSQEKLVIINQENVGGAGGFHRGIKEAYERGADWIWLLDDDAFPKDDCLFQLKSNERLSSELDVVLAPLVIEGERVDYIHRGYIDLSRPKFPMLQKFITGEVFLIEENNIYISFSSFIGMFIGRKVVEKIGYPESKYFIFHDDVEYSIRIIKNNFPIFLVKPAVVFHKFYNDELSFNLNNYINGSKKAGTAKLNVQNKIIKKILKPSNPNVFISFIAKRNLIHTIKKHKGLSFYFLMILIVDMIKSLMGIVFFTKSKKLGFQLYIQTYKQGLTGRFDNNKFLTLKSALNS